uniref:Uncharacterized protein n=1 Tax=Ornithodoros turicata TaxID=34597 RepID=A0A2R5LLN7_9ACAR
MAEEIRKNIRRIIQGNRKEDRERRINDRRALEYEEQMTLDEFCSLLQAMKSRRKDTSYWRSIKNTLALGDDYCDKFVKSEGAFSMLMSAFLCSDASTQVQATGCIANLASSVQVAPRVCSAAAPYLLTFLAGSYNILQDCAAVALGNLALNGCCEQLGAMGFLCVTASVLKSPYEFVVHSCLISIECYTFSAAISSRHIEETELLENLLLVIKAGFLSEPCQILFNVYARVEDLKVSEELSASICQAILDFYPELDCTSADDIMFLTAMQRCLAAMAAASPQVGEQVAVGLLKIDVLRACLLSPYSHLRKECIWLINNITPWLPSLDDPTAHALGMALYMFARDKKQPFAENILCSHLGKYLMESFDTETDEK